MPFIEAATWNLDQLISDIEAKRQQKLTDFQQKCLKGALAGYLSKDIALKLTKSGIKCERNTVANTLAEQVNPYIKAILNYPKELEGRMVWSRALILLENAGYKIQDNLMRNLGRLSNLEQIPPGKSQLTFVLMGHPEEVERMRRAISTYLETISGDTSMTVQSIAPGSVVLVVQGSHEGCRRIEELFRTKQLTELLGFPIEEIQVLESPITEPAISPGEKPVNLSQWLQDVFETGWQTIEEIFGPRQLAFRAAVVKRAKQIDLGGDSQVALLVDLPREADEEIDILLRVYPAGDQDELPENLKLIVLDESGEALEEVPAKKGDDCIRQPLSGSPGDRFGVKIALGNVSVSENFVI